MARILGATLNGIEGVAVEVEVQLSSQLPRIDIVGLPEAAVRESAARVRAAIASVGQRFPAHRITVNLAPANIRKRGAGLDLPIAIGILGASGAVDAEQLEGLGLIGELALDGRLRPIQGALAMTLALRDAGRTRVIVPSGNAVEAALTPQVEVLHASDLGAVVRHLVTGSGLSVAVPEPFGDSNGSAMLDVADVRGQERSKRALEIAAAGGHAVFLRGSPGAGKTMLAQRLPGFLPPLEFAEALEVTQIHGAAGQLSPESPIARTRPFRAPHHTTSSAGLLGGGNPPGPGEVSLAHHGVLFLDELTEFDRRTLEGLREVLEQRRVLVARARNSCLFPARFLWIAAANPCPCGWLGSGTRDCRCDDAAISRYASRISGPLLDRIDLHVSVMPVRWSQLDSPASGPTTSDLRSRVEAARSVQSRRSRDTRSSVNAELPDSNLDESVRATAEARLLLGRAVDRLGLSARSARRLLRVARTIADLAGESSAGVEAMAEALSYRSPGASRLHGQVGDLADF
jgi:magnesium chelatase family protein